jgi:FAD-binding domain
LLSSIFKSRVYELFSHLHRACALGLVFTTWRHLYNKSGVSTWCIAGAAAAYALTLSIQVLRIAVRNLAFGRRAECLVNHQGNNLEVIVFPARPWSIRAGERVNLSIPSAGLMSIFQMHPFVITWWDNNDLGNLESFTLLISPRSGFTNKLKMLPSTRHRAWIDGPYGPDRVIGTPIFDYGHIFMVATGIGIGAQIPYLKQILEGYRRGRVRTQKIVLIWQMDLEGQFEVYMLCYMWY